MQLRPKSYSGTANDYRQVIFPAPRAQQANNSLAMQVALIVLARDCPLLEHLQGFNLAA